MAFMLLVEMGILLFLRKKLAGYFVTIIQILGGSRSTALWGYALISLPGILTHEISHFLMAAFLGLRTGAIELLPQLDADGGVDLGSVQVEKKDPFRSSLVGLAPFVSGITLVAWLSSLLPLTLPLTFTWLHLAIIYLVVSIALQMAPSKRDMASWPVVIILLILSASAFLFLGFRIPHMQPITEKLNEILRQTVYGLGLATGLAAGLAVIGAMGVWGGAALKRRTLYN